MRWIKTVAMTAALSMAGLSLPATAQAGHYGHGYGYSKGYYSKSYSPRRHYRAHRRSGGDALAAGIFGLAAGAIIAGALSQPRTRYYSAPAYGHTYAAPVYGAPAPGSADWYAYCASKYRSFDPHSGTFQPYNGPRRLCQ